LIVLLGNFCLAIATCYFILPFNLLTGGLAGLSVIANKLLGLNETVVIYVLDFGLFLLGAWLLGRDFAIKTGLSAVCYPLFVSLLNRFPYVLDINEVVVSIYAGLFLGAGVGLVFRTGGSTGGTDIPSLILNKYLHIDLPTATLIIDALTVVLGVVAYGIDAALIGLISVYVSAVTVGKMLVFGGETSKAVYIISDKADEISSAIQDELERGVTFLEGLGGYRKDKKEVVFVVIRQRQYGDLRKILNRIDPFSFVTITDATEVMGQGFSFSQEEKHSKISEGD